MREINPDFGFQSATVSGNARRSDAASCRASRWSRCASKFSPEFVNRIDHVITYQPLDAESFAAITDHEIDNLQNHVNTRLGTRCFTIEVPFETRQWLIEKGTSPEYGARELKRTIHKHLTQPLATLVAKNQIEPGARVRVEVDRGSGRLCRCARPAVGEEAGAGASHRAAGGR